MKRRTKILGFITAATLALSMSLFTACGTEEEESALRGTFTYSDTVTVKTSNEQTDAGDKSFLYSTTYPQMDKDQNVAYNMDQSLKLNRNYVYSYNYTVTLKNPGDWGGEVGALSVSIVGTFDYVDEGNGIYSVLLSNPTGGIQQVYGASISGGNIYNWGKHTDADLSLDYAALAHKKGYVYDEYVCSRVVVVDKNARSLADNIFFPQLLNYISNYSSY